jgi:hypothetical protein
MFFYDHDMARDDFMNDDYSKGGDPEKIDLISGLTAMSMFKNNPGPLQPFDVNQDVKHALASHPYCVKMLDRSGVLSDSLLRELEQMISDKSPQSKDLSSVLPSGMMVFGFETKSM